MGHVALLFPGQGAQTVGMGRTACESLPAARELFDRAATLLGYDLADLCFNGPKDRLDATNFSQPALYVCGLAALELMKRDHADAVASCRATAGLSLGEYTALAFAGVFDFETGLRIVQVRGQAMQDAATARPSGMSAVLGLEREPLETLCDAARGDDVLQVANLLCPGNIAVSGSHAALARLAELATAAGAMKVLPLAVAGAFHTAIMQPAVERLAAAVQAAPMQRPRIPVLSNVDAEPHVEPEEIRALLIRQIVSPVLWEATMRRLLADGCDQFYEVGPGTVLAGLLKRVNRKLPCTSITP